MKEGLAQSKAGKKSTAKPGSSWGLNRGLSVAALILRVVATVGTLGSAIAAGTTEETLPFFTLLVVFHAEYKDLPTFKFFVIANSLVCANLVLSLPLSIFHVIITTAVISRIVLVIFDTVMLATLTSGASAAAAIVYLAHKGNASANWFAICQQYNNFCERVSGSLVHSFVRVALLILVIIFSGWQSPAGKKPKGSCFYHGVYKINSGFE